MMPVPSGRAFTGVKRAAVLAVMSGVLWGAWQYAQNRPDPMTPGAIAKTQRMSDEAFRWAAERARRRYQLTKAIAPEFRANPIVVQLYDFLVASLDSTSGVGMGRFATPGRLSDADDWERMGIAAPLPPAFAEPERDGYLFEFMGVRCGPMPNNLSAPQTDCDQFV